MDSPESTNSVASLLITISEPRLTSSSDVAVVEFAVVVLRETVVLVEEATIVVDVVDVVVVVEVDVVEVELVGADSVALAELSATARKS